MLLTTRLVVVLSIVCTLASAVRIDSSFKDVTYRIERDFAASRDTQQLLHQIVYEGIDASTDRLSHRETLKLVADRGEDHPAGEDLESSQFASLMQEFISPDFHHHDPHDPSKNYSLIYYMEHLAPDALEKNQNFVNQVVENSILEDGGTLHLYMSAPNMAALKNHTDTTDIVVLQLDGEKEWLLCSEKPTSSEPATLRSRKYEDTLFDHKLGSCATYTEDEIDRLDCSWEVLYPGDALFLPRRVLHSARAAPHTFSAHLTFAFQEEGVCRDTSSRDDEPPSFLEFLSTDRALVTCNANCDDSCDQCCNENCSNSCNESCSEGCDGAWFTNCDSNCDSGCDGACNTSCDCNCDSSCDVCF